MLIVTPCGVAYVGGFYYLLVPVLGVYVKLSAVSCRQQVDGARAEQQYMPFGLCMHVVLLWSLTLHSNRVMPVHAVTRCARVHVLGVDFMTFHITRFHAPDKNLSARFILHFCMPSASALIIHMSGQGTAC
jgi:hypothetical protein